MDWQKKRSTYPWILYFLWTFCAIALMVCVMIFVKINSGDLPTFEDLENPKYDLASIVFDSHGEEFGKYYIENREQIAFEDLSPNILKALLSTEDQRFYNHAGVDLKALFRVAFKTLLLQRESSGGGSTITQQLAKLLYNRPNLQGKSSLSRAIELIKIKLQEWVTAVKLEKAYTKEEIISMYLNKFEFINGAHGIQAAAEIYFGKDQKNLSVSESATLVGMLKNPARYNPKRFPERAKTRRNIVLYQMYKHREFDEEVFDSLKVIELDLSNFRLSDQSEGPAPYFRAELTKWLKELLAQPQYLKFDGTSYNIYTDGLKIHTTIDLKYQRHAEEAVKAHMSWNQERYWRAWRGMNPFIFRAEEYQTNLRRESVDRRIHYSERYLKLFDHKFNLINETIAEVFDNFELSEPPLRILFNSGNPRIQVDSFPNKALRTQYSRIINSKYWNQIENTWRDFRNAYEHEFNTAIPLKIFDYEQGEALDTMTPRDSVIFHLRHLQSGLLAVDPVSGKIKAWVGGIGHKYFKFDHINSRRQVGSTIKPFVYATAIGLQGISPCQEFDDIQYTIAPGDDNFHLNKEWSPSNANGEFTGNKYNLYQGLLYSKNSITVRLVKEMGTVEVIRELLDNVGISKTEILPDGRLLIPRLPSICLGSVDLSVMEMTGAYTAFSNNGIYTKPLFVDYIEDKNGKLIYRSSQIKRRALNSLYNAVIVDMLKNNTGGRFGMGIKSQNGGKTGTTNDFADAWFIGITPELVTGIWVGGDEKWVRFYTLDDGQGFVLSRPIFQDFMKRIEEDEEIVFNTTANFTPPPKEFYEIIDCNRYKRGEPEEERISTLEKQALSDEFEEEFEKKAKKKSSGNGGSF